MNSIDATALAIFMFEGANKCDPTTHNIRNLNPGNAGGYRVFTNFADGWAALVADISYKVRHHLSPTGTMLDFFNLYAPGADHNDPRGYARFVCVWLTRALGINIALGTSIGDIFPLVSPDKGM
jgi:hypothetical protein